MSKKKILYYGLNRSGTNYLQVLLTHYFDLEYLNIEGIRDNPLHKHFRLYDDKSLIGRPNFMNSKSFKSFEEFENKALENTAVDLYLIISKDPYSWSISYEKWGRKNNWDPFSHHPVLEYNEFYRKWLIFSKETDKIFFIRYIDLLEDKHMVMNTLKKKFHFDLNTKPKNKLKIRKVPRSHHFSDRKARYYLDQKYLKEFSKEQLDIINEAIDHDLIKNLGYKSYFSAPD